MNKIVTNSEFLIYKNNYLIEASYKLTLNEQRLMLFCIGKLNPLEPVQRQEIIIEEFASQFGMNKDSAYAQVKQAIDIIYNRSIKVKDPNQEKEFRWIQEKAYLDNQGRAFIVFSNAIMPYLCQLETQFTKYRLKYVQNFDSPYSIRIYELLTQFKSINKRVVNISDLRDMLGISNKFSTWNDFRRFIIDRSISEINEKSDLRVSYKPIKRGRAFFSIEFYIEVERQIDFLEKQDIANSYLADIKNKLK